MTLPLLARPFPEGRWPRAIAALLIVIALGVLAGWCFDIEPLKSAVPGLVPMNPVTAICFLIASSGLVVLASSRRVASAVATLRIFAGGLLILPALSLSRLLLPWDLGPDRLLFPARLAVPLGGFPNRMAPITGGLFVVIGAVFLLLINRRAVARRIGAALATLTGLVALIVVVEYGYEAGLPAVGGQIPIALNTAMAFMLLAAGILAARPEDGLVSVLRSRAVGGVLARRLLPAALLIPLIAGFLELRWERAGFFDAAGGAAIVAIVTMLTLAVLVWRSALLVDEADGARSRAEAALRNLNQTLEQRVVDRTVALQHANVSILAETRARSGAEEGQRRAADELRGWFEASPLAMCGLTPDNIVLSWNAAAESLFGWTRSEVIGETLPIIDPALDAESRELTQKVLAGTALTGYETRRLRRDGTSVDVSISTAALYDAEGVPCGVLAVYAGIGERKQLETQLRQAQKMDAIGRLAGGVAHDFNNILMVMQASSEFLLEDLSPDDERSRANVLEIQGAAQRAARLTRQLLTFSRQQPLELHVLDLTQVATQIEPMLRRVVPANIAFNFRLGADLDAVLADAGQLDQVILNLVVNARDAMPDGGSILVETANVLLDAEYPRGHLSAKAGPHVVLSVTDTGTGMSAETQSRIFEPFFTTKAKGQGTGLGLATVYGIVKQLGGHIWVYSEVGVGSTFKVYFPRHVGTTTVAAPAAVRVTGTAMRGAKVLLVEDDEKVRKVVRQILEREDVVVTEMTRADDALQHVEAEGVQYDLVISDMIMPGMTGLALRSRLRERGYAAPVLLISGYSEAAISKDSDGASLEPHLEKPFSAAGLVAKVEDLLTESALA